MPISQEQADLTNFFDSLNVNELQRVLEILGTAGEMLHRMATGSVAYDEGAVSRFFGLTESEVGRKLFHAVGSKVLPFLGIGMRLRDRYEAAMNAGRS